LLRIAKHIVNDRMIWPNCTLGMGVELTRVDNCGGHIGDDGDDGDGSC
jgi:hypothetical protein